MRNFKNLILPAPLNGGFRLESHWVWDGSVIKGEDGRYHMFASRWSKKIPFIPNWVAASEVVRAVSNTPEGPYTFVEVVIPRRGKDFWDGMMSHNPTIRRVGKKYLLFYTGTTYQFPAPTETSGQLSQEQVAEARMNQQVGLLVSENLEGPWIRSDKPIITRNPSPQKWDSAMATNASPCVMPDGSIYVVYKGIAHMKDFMRLGLAKATAWDQPFTRVLEKPLFEFDEKKASVEDPFFWHDGTQFNMLMKDMEGHLCGEKHAGLFATSKDAIHWNFKLNEVAYSRKVKWSDGSKTTQGNLERPSLLFNDQGQPSHFYCATAAVHFSKHAELKSTHVMVFPLNATI